MLPPPTTTAISTSSSRARLGDLLGDALHDRGVDAEAGAGVGERLTRELQHHPADWLSAISGSVDAHDARTLVLADLHAGEPSQRGVAAEALDQLADR